MLTPTEFDDKLLEKILEFGKKHKYAPGPNETRLLAVEIYSETVKQDKTYSIESRILYVLKEWLEKWFTGSIWTSRSRPSRILLKNNSEIIITVTNCNICITKIEFYQNKILFQIDLENPKAILKILQYLDSMCLLKHGWPANLPDNVI